MPSPERTRELAVIVALMLAGLLYVVSGLVGQ